MIDELLQLTTTVISDAMDDLNVNGILTGILPRHRPPIKFAGPVFTAQFKEVGTVASSQRPGGGVGHSLEAVLKRMPEGHIVFIDLCERVDVATWGDLASRLAKDRGMFGTIINGGCRDIQDVEILGYPVSSLGVAPRRGRGRVALEAMQVSLNVQGVSIAPGDMILADQNGVAVLPQADARKIINRAQEIERQEQLLEARIKEDNISDNLWDVI